MFDLTLQVPTARNEVSSVEQKRFAAIIPADATSSLETYMVMNSTHLATNQEDSRTHRNSRGG